jgi:hypothetical protein
MDLFLTGVIYLAFFLLGQRLCRLCGLRFSEIAESVIFCTALGQVAVALIILVFAFLHIITPATAWGILALILLIHNKELRSLGKNTWLRIRTQPGIRISSHSGWFGIFNLVILALLILLALSMALAPPFKTDALVYHLAVPKAFLQNQGIVNLPNNIYSFFPQLYEMLYLFCLALGSDSLAQLMGLGTTFLFLAAMTLFYRQMVSRRYAGFVPVLYFSTLTFFLISYSAYVDLQTGAFSFLAFYAWHLWKTRDERPWFYLMVIFTAAAAATKLTAYIIAPLAFLGIVLQAREKNDSSRLIQDILILTMAVAAFLLPWFGRNYYFTGNPFAPLFMQFFPTNEGINWDVARSLSQLKYYSAFGMGRDLLDFLMLPIHLTFYSKTNSLNFDGSIGYLYFALLPGLFWLRKKWLPVAVLFAVLLIFWFIHFQYVRLLTSALALFTLLSVAGIEKMTRPPHLGSSGTSTDPIPTPWYHWRSLVPIALALVVLVNLALIAMEWKRHQPLSYLAGQESREQYLSRQIPGYSLYQKVNQELGPEDKVLMVYMRNFGYLLDRPFVSDTFFEAFTLQTILQDSPDANKISSRLQSRGLTHLLFDFNYVFGESSALSENQRRILKDFLNSKAELLESKNGYALYRFMLN